MNYGKYKHIVLSVATGGLLLAGLFLLLLVPISTTHAWPVMPMPSPAPPATRPPGPAFVKPDGTGGWCLQNDPCGSIQYSIDQCEPGNGDTIYIAGGVYTGTGEAVITITKSITLYGGWDGGATDAVVRDPDTRITVLDGENARRDVFVSGTVSVTLDGLRLTQGKASGFGLEGQGGGAYVVTATVTITNCSIYSNTANKSGSGLYIRQSDQTILRDNRIYSNTATNMGGGLCLNRSTARLSGNTIAGNTSMIGGGLYLLHSDAALSENTIARNADRGLSLLFSDATLTDNVIAENWTDNSGGGLFLYQSNSILSRNVITSNNAANDGGGLFVGYSAATLSGNTVISNTAGRNGGGLFLRYSAATLVNNIVAENRAGTAGSGLYIIASAPHLLHNTIARNSGGDASGLFVTSLAGDTSDVILTNTILVSHTMGITVTAESTATLEGTLWGSGSWADNADWGGDGTIVTGTVNVWGDPAFVNPDRGNYHIGPGSAAVDQGVDAGVRIDADGEPRPQGAGYDIGADEFPAMRIYLPLALRNCQP